MKEIKFSAQEKLDLRKSFLGVIWGLSLVFFEIGDDAVMGKGFEWPVSIVVFVLASLLIFKPQKDWLWLSLGLLIPIQILFQLPAVKNHSLFFAAFGVAVAVSYLTSRFSSKHATQNWLERNEPFLRVVFFVGYGAAALSKLNAGFFNYQISCANSMAMDVFSWLPVKIPFDTFTWLPFAVSAAELFVFFGLMFKRVRPWALIVAVAFHFSLSLQVHAAAMAFNPALFAMLALFLPPEASEFLTVKWRQIAYRLGRKQIQTLAGSFAVLLFGMLAFFKFIPPGPFMLVPSFLLRILYSITMVAMFAFCAFKFRNSAQETRTAWVPSLTGWVVVVVIALNAASPYLGFKTGSTFTMFSNLRVEGGTSNHFFIPRLAVDSPQDDLVAVLDSSDKKLKSLNSSKALVTWFTFQQLAAGVPQASVHYVRNGQEFNVDQIGTSDILKDYSPFWASVLYYRPIPVAGTCAW